MIFDNETFEIEKELLKEINNEKKFLTFKKLFKILELNALLRG
ncbi:MAG: hypothetical protein ACI4IX_04200 [Acutalibacteraceae bacterium]